MIYPKLTQWAVAAVQTDAGRQDDSEARAKQLDQTRMEKALISISYKLGVHYPSLWAMMNRANLHLLC